MDIFDEVDPVELTEFSREILDVADAAPGSLADVLPNRPIDDISVQWTVSEEKALLGQIRSFDTETPIASPDADGEQRMAALAPVGLKQRFTEYEQLQRARRNSPETVQQAAQRKAVSVAKATLDRVILLRGEALQNGKLAINENGIVQNVDFARRADFTRTAGQLFTSIEGDAMEFLEQMLEDWRSENNDGVPDTFIGSRKALNALRKNLVRNGHFGIDLVTPQRIRNQDVDELLTDVGFPTFTVNDRKAGGRRVIAEDRIILASSSLAGRTYWGRTVESFDPEYSEYDSTEAPGLLVGAYKQNDPAVKWIRANAISLPVIVNPNATMAAKVI